MKVVRTVQTRTPTSEFVGAFPDNRYLGKLVYDDVKHWFDGIGLDEYMRPANVAARITSSVMVVIQIVGTPPEQQAIECIRILQTYGQAIVNHIVPREEHRPRVMKELEQQITDMQAQLTAAQQAARTTSNSDETAHN